MTHLKRFYHLIPSSALEEKRGIEAIGILAEYLDKLDNEARKEKLYDRLTAKEQDSVEVQSVDSVRGK